MTEPLAAQFDPHAIEAPLYAWWSERGLFRVDADAPGRAYVIQMPPPNVTAVLHAGHGLNDTIQDVLIRFERMRGRKTLWVPGTDHAGIATQNVVERQLALVGQTRFDLGREAFVERVRMFVRETGGVILDQLKALGASCDWTRTYYTLDPGLSRAVREVFVRLYDKGLIYRGHYIVNWCPRCLTTLSNEEVDKEDREGNLWHFRYPVDGSDQAITVATTRPETVLGDTGVAVHPDDLRYRELVGRNVRLPLVDRLIPIVTDAAVDPAFGTGAVKVTPAHDPLDYDIGRRAGLDTIAIMTPDARMNDNVPERFRGFDRFDTRRRVVAEFDALGLLVKVEPHRHAVGQCYRCGTVVEPRLSDQWFVRMAPLAEPALQAYRDGRLRFIPEFQGEVYARWLENIRDWCISRQLWWGHRIPVWYCEREKREREKEKKREGEKEKKREGGCGRTVVSRDDPPSCPDCGGVLRQDDDVLDTWFSSWIVPFTSLGWPEATPDLRAFYPGSTLVTAPEILFLWVSRMVMSGLEFMGNVPFDTVYLHGTVRDTQHRKMSKSLGNGIDPVEVIDRYGADALRYTVVSGMSVGTDLMLDPDDLETSFAPGRHFANKLWNIGRLLLGQLEGHPVPTEVSDRELELADRWILARARGTVRLATQHYEAFRLNEAASAIYHFLWSDLADWYLEQIKPRLYGTEPGGETARAVAATVFDVALRLLHPIMPFITETLWLRLPATAAGTSICVAPWPEQEDVTADGAPVEAFERLQEMVTAVRIVRAKYQVPPGRTVDVALNPGSDLTRRVVGTEGDTIRRLAKIGALSVSPRERSAALEAESSGGGDGWQGGGWQTAAATTALSDGSVITIPLATLIDRDRECNRLGAETARLEALVAAQLQKLDNQAFISRAPATVVEREREKLANWQTQVRALGDQRRALGCPD